MLKGRLLDSSIDDSDLIVLAVQNSLLGEKLILEQTKGRASAKKIFYYCYFGDIPYDTLYVVTKSSGVRSLLKDVSRVVSYTGRKFDKK